MRAIAYTLKYKQYIIFHKTQDGIPWNIVGPALAKELGFQQLIIELDALSVVILMNNETENLLMEPLLTDCRNLLKEIPNKRVIHAFREANQCADALAKLGPQSLYSFAVFCNPPPVVESILAFDKANMRCNRRLNP